MRSTRSVAPRRPRPVLESSPYVAPRYQSRLWSRVIFAFLILGLAGVIGGGGGLYWALHRAQGNSSRSVAVHVGLGDTVTSVANRLSHQGLVSSPLLFRLDARLQGLAGKLKVGDYSVRPNMSIDQMVAALMVYHVRTVQFSIPEGWRSEQIASTLTRYGVTARQFLTAVRHPDATTLNLPVLRDKPKGVSLEGYLFPNTYRVPLHYGAQALVRLMTRTLGEQFSPAMRATAASHGWSVYQVLTLASIVEREARVPDERPIIASVYINRLKKGIGLFADPTIQYAVGTPRNWWPILSVDQLRVGSPYNTYIHTGLPPGPIANPGLASIEAVVHPQSTPYFYFVAKGHGRHAFARTYAEQLQNQQKYQHP